MSEATLNGLRVLACEIHEPARGVWTARVEVDDEDGKVTGPVTLTIGSESWVGTTDGQL